MKKILLSSLFFVVTLFGESSYDDFYALYETKNYNEARQGFQTLVKEYNDSDAAYILGYMYEHGEGCKKDKVKADYYYKISAHSYYIQHKDDPSKDVHKEKKNLMKYIDKADPQTAYTIRQYAQSLYNVKAYKANYFLPVSYRYRGKYRTLNENEIKKLEMEFQVSLKYDFATNILGLHEIYSFGYTQKSFWQAYGESAYFRESNYNPEFFTTIPVNDKHIKAVRISIAHQSNGRGGEEERSWNYMSGSVYYQTGLLFTELRLWYRFHDAIDYNPDLIDYMGHGELRFLLPYKKHLAKLLLRSNFDGANALEFSYTYPFFHSKDLFFYLKVFHGYGESLIDYNHYIDKVGFGFSISR
jgi:phospholipase A1